MSALKVNHENPINGQLKHSVQEETHVVSVTEIISLDSQHNRPQLLQYRRSEMTEEDFRKETL